MRAAGMLLLTGGLLFAGCESRNSRSYHDEQLARIDRPTKHADTLRQHGWPDLHIGITTDEQLQAWFGKPERVDKDSVTGAETWHYYLHKKEFTPNIEGDYRLLTPYYNLQARFQEGVLQWFDVTDLGR